MSRYVSAQAGFTLLELLVGISLITIFSLMLFGSIRVGLDADRHVAAAAGDADAAVKIDSFLRGSIQMAQPAWIAAPNGGHLAFEGTEHRLTFIAPTPQNLGGVGFSTYRLSAIPDGNGSRLIAEITPIIHPGGTMTAIVVNSASDISFGYYGASSDNRSVGWQSSWQSRIRMPLLVSVNAPLGAGQAAGSPPLIIRPKIDIDVSCRLDAQTATCEGQ